MSLLSEYIEFKNGKKRPAKQGVYPVYGGNGILSFVEQYNLDIGVVIGRVGAYCGSVFLSEGKCWVSDNAIGGKNRPNADLDYIYYLLKGLRLNSRQIGTSQPLLTQEILNNIQVQIPRLEIQKRIVNIIKPLDEKIKVNEQINHNLTLAKSRIDISPDIRRGKSASRVAARPSFSSPFAKMASMKAPTAAAN